ncbi:MAG: hypothetical protein SF051_08735, partial [Elusimicrobiota bacterium]|nr:hypothetical protein [Elusimicrobiota bacterium]
MRDKRRGRPAALEYAVFGLAAFLALFLIYEAAKRAAPVAPARSGGVAPVRADLAADPPTVFAPVEPPERGGVGPLPRIATDRIER